MATIRILENQHLLDATEIFRKLNVHKKVRRPRPGIDSFPVKRKRREERRG